MAFFETSHKYSIIDHPRLFQDEAYILSYKLIILHSIWHYYHHGGTVYNTSKLINDMLEIIHDSDKSLYVKKCLELCSFIKDREHGLVLIDRSKACYPLVFYPPDDIPEHGDRVSALKNAVLDLNKNTEFFDEVLKKIFKMEY